MFTVIAVIPARMASSRLPGKPLADILGLPMIEHVRRRVALSQFLEEVIVATCDREIFDVVTEAGGKAVMTSDKHTICTDRVAEAVQDMDVDIIINVQGDEPFVIPEMLEALVTPLREEKELLCSNLMVPIKNGADFQNPSAVKVVTDNSGNALYFSREPIPSPKKVSGSDFPKFRQTGFVAFRKDFLLKFSKLQSTFLEKIESVDMMRAVEYGYRVRMVKWDYGIHDVDTPEDLKIANELMKTDKLFKIYKER